MSIPIIVTTCPKYAHLLEGFVSRFIKHWGRSFSVDIAQENESWSRQMKRVCQSITDSHFIRLCEDFWMYQDADVKRIDEVSAYAVHNGIPRIGLQGVDEGYKECSEPFQDDVFKLKSSAEYLCSFEASIYCRDFLLRHLPEDAHIWESETSCSRSAREESPTVLVTKEKLVFYKDATRRGQSRVEGLADII